MIPQDRISQDQLHLNGQPCIRGTRMTVRRVLEIAALYPSRADREREFPELDDEDVKQALHFAAKLIPG
jgi:uncharacterized protein (DUF433 family)